MDKYVKDSDIYDIVMSQFCASSDETEAALNAIIEGTRALPPDDVRPVMLCRDCKYWDRERLSCEGLARCNTGESGIRYRNRNDFCSRGEIKLIDADAEETVVHCKKEENANLIAMILDADAEGKVWALDFYENHSEPVK